MVVKDSMNAFRGQWEALKSDGAALKGVGEHTIPPGYA